MTTIEKGSKWEKRTTEVTWHYKAVTRMEPFKFGRPEWSEDEEPYLCWDGERYYLSEFSRTEGSSSGLSLFDGVASISYGAGVGVRINEDNNEEGQLIYFYVS